MHRLSYLVVSFCTKYTVTTADQISWFIAKSLLFQFKKRFMPDLS